MTIAFDTSITFNHWPLSWTLLSRLCKCCRSHGHLQENGEADASDPPRGHACRVRYCCRGPNEHLRHHPHSLWFSPRLHAMAAVMAFTTPALPATSQLWSPPRKQRQRRLHYPLLPCIPCPCNLPSSGPHGQTKKGEKKSKGSPVLIGGFGVF